MTKVKIYSLLLIVMMFWGLNLVALKVLVTYFSPLAMTGVRIFIAGISVLSLLALFKRLKLPKGNEWKWIIIASLLGVVIHHLFLSMGLEKTTAINGGVILGFSPLITAILALLFGFNRYNLLTFIGFILGTFGVTLAVMNGGRVNTSFSTGDLLIFISITAQAFSFLIIRKISQNFDSVLLTGYMLVTGSIVLLALGLILEPSQFLTFKGAPFEMYAILFGSALLATAIGHIVYNFAISKIGAAETAIFGNFNTIFGILGSALLLKEQITPIQILGCIAIIIGVLFGTGAVEEIRSKRRKRE